MLKSLQTVKWDELKTAYGPASPVPQFIMNLTSQDHNTLREASFSLWSYICHQGTVYSATQYAVPFLIELLMEPSVIEKESIVGLLADIACGGSAVSESDTWQRQYFKEQGWDFDTALKQATADVKAARDAVNAGFEQYVQLLSNQSPIVRMSLVDLFGILTDIPIKVMPVLLDLITHEPHDGVRAEAIHKSSAYLANAPTSKSFTDALSALLTQLLDAVTLGAQSKFAVSLALIQLKPDNYPNLCEQVVLTALATPQGIHPYSEFSLPEHYKAYEMGTVEEVLVAISHLNHEKSIQVLIRALNLVTESDHAHSIAVMLLGRALTKRPFMLSYRGVPSIEGNDFFFAVDGPASSGRIQTRIYPVCSHHTEITQLGTLEKKAVLAVLDCQVLWSIPSNISDAFGLPTDELSLRNKLLS